MIIKGRIVKFFSISKNHSYAEFIFNSDFDNKCPRFTALCEGNIPDVVPGVPMKIDFPVDDIGQITTVDLREFRNKKLKPEVISRLYNCITSAYIDYNDDAYAKKVLCQVKGISERIADQILNAIDGHLEKLLSSWNDQMFWKQFKGSKRYKKKLMELVNHLFTTDSLFKKYGRYGIGYSQLDILTVLYGDKAEEKLIDNPYVVLDKLDLSFQVADNMAKDFGFKYLDERRIRAMIRCVLKKNEENGNTCMYQSDFYAACARFHDVSAWKDYVVSPYYILAVVTKMEYVNYENGLVGFMSTFTKEADIAYHIQRLMKVPTELNTHDDVFNEIKDKYNEDQLAFLKAFDKNSITLLLGRGGTGKTHTVCGAIELFKRHCPDGEVNLCAPTARAAGVLKESTGYSASTMHLMLGLNPHSMANESDVQELNAQLIVVDEMSMVDTEMMYYLLRAVKSGSKLVLSGDPNQLESVGCGSVLSDLIKSEIVPQITLNKIMRQSEGSAVIENCSRILAGNPNFIETNHFRIHNCRTEYEALECLQSCYSGNSHETQILSTTNKGIVGTEELNNLFNNQDDNYIVMPHGHFYVGDKVIFTSNNYESDYCNGDIGYIETIVPPLRVKMQNGDKILTVDEKDYSDIKHATAITIHKSQGSEYQKVFIVLTEKPLSMLTRNMVNTAISRTRNDVDFIVVGNALKVAASNRFKTDRLTRLAGLLSEAKPSIKTTEKNPKEEKNE